MPPAPRCPRYESLDVWRGVACLSVVVFHAVCGYVATPELDARVRADGGSVADWLVVAAARLWVGVPLFFVISGYCIAAAADAARRKPRPAATFFWRRARRIYPPLWALLAVAAGVVALLPPAAVPGPIDGYEHPLPYPWDVAPAQWVGSVTLTEEWRPHLGGPPKGYFSGHLWTLCYEEQFYLVVGLAVAVAGRRLFPVVGVVTGLVALNVLDLNGLVGDRIGVDLSRFQWRVSGFFFDGLWLAFAAGVGVYYRTNYATPTGRMMIDGLLVAGGVMGVGAIPSAWDFRANLSSYLVVASAAGLALGWLHRWDGAIAQARVTAPLRWAGRMCYSLYLVHAPVAILVQWNLFRAGVDTPAEALLVNVPVVTAVSLALGAGFFRLVERRFLNPPARPAAVTPSAPGSAGQAVDGPRRPPSASCSPPGIRPPVRAS